MSERKPQTQRQSQKEQTRKLLIETATEQFALRGFAATRTTDIAKAAKVSHGTVFAHFATQEALIIAVIEAFGARISQRLHDLNVGSGSVKDVLEAHLKGLTEYETFYIRLVIEGRMLPESARNTIVTIQSVVSFHLSQAAEIEMKEERIAAMAIHLLFNTWIGLIHHYLANNDLFAPEESVLIRYGQELLTHFMSLITIEIPVRNESLIMEG